MASWWPGSGFNGVPAPTCPGWVPTGSGTTRPAERATCVPHSPTTMSTATKAGARKERMAPWICREATPGFNRQLDPLEGGYPVHFPGLSAVFREGLLEAERVPGD